MNDELKIEWDIIERSKVDPQNFELLYKKYYQQILKFVYKRMDRVEDAYDITAETFGKALANIGKYKNQGFKFSSWLYRIAINEINEFYRKAKKQRTVNIDDTSSKFLAEETGRESAELKQVLKEALQYLDTDELQLIELRFFEEHPFIEVAEILGITENNAKTKTYRVIAKLRDVFQKIN